MISEISTRIDEFEHALRSMDSSIRERSAPSSPARHIIIEARDLSTGLHAFDSLPGVQDGTSWARLRTIGRELAKRHLTVEIWADRRRCAVLGKDASSRLTRLLGLRHVEVNSWRCLRTLWRYKDA